MGDDISEGEGRTLVFGEGARVREKWGRFSCRISYNGNFVSV